MIPRQAMAESAGKVLEGVFAVKKPQSLSSAQVLRDLQHVFAKSKTFKPLLEQTQSKDSDVRHRAKRRRYDDASPFKMGHGGTLDPLATGVLIVGIGRGTRFLQNFLDCTKTYETVVLFGKATDTYDVAGKIVASKDHAHITKVLVEEKMSAFRGAIKQVPPIYSALKIDGMKGYEYARSGKPLPREMPARDMNVTECELVEWFDPGQHSFRWPAQEASDEEIAVFQKFMQLGKSDLNDATIPSTEKTSNEQDMEDKADQKLSKRALNKISKEEKASMHTHELNNLSEAMADAPAARIRLTASSGFYVRSLAHDLGIACNSFATMAELARTRQANFTTSEVDIGDLIPVVDHADFQKDEDVWASRLIPVLRDWIAKNPVPEGSEAQRREKNWSNNSYDRGRSRQDQKRPYFKRRNSSSPES